MQPAQKIKLIELIISGRITAAEAATALKLPRMTINRWLDTEAAKNARAQYVASLIAPVPQIVKDQQKAAPEAKEAMPKIVSQTNPRKAEALKAIRKGTKTPEQAAKFAGVPLSGIVGWCKLARIKLADKYNQPRRKPPET